MSAMHCALAHPGKPRRRSEWASPKRKIPGHSPAFPSFIKVFQALVAPMDHERMESAMKQLLALSLSIFLLLGYGLTAAAGEDASSSATPVLEAQSNPDGMMKTLGKERVFTRSGPGTGFRDTGTYTVAGGSVRVYSCAYDRSGNCWVQCEFSYKDKLRRLYTRLEEMDAETFDVSDVPEEQPLGYKAKVIAVSKLYFGPGDTYDTYAKSFKSNKGATVYIVALEGDYALVEWTTSKQSYRVWVPASILDY